MAEAENEFWKEVVHRSVQNVRKSSVSHWRAKMAKNRARNALREAGSAEEAGDISSGGGSGNA